MNKMIGILITLSLLITGGCGGYYTLTSGDHVAPTSSEVPVVVRLQRNDFFVLNLGERNIPIRFRVEDGQLRAAYTDKLGYAGTTVMTPSEPGKYTLNVDLMDRQGDEVHVESPLYVWDRQSRVVAVDADSLPLLWEDASADAAEGIAAFAGSDHVIYFTRRDLPEHDNLHQILLDAGYPDGPVLLWQRQRWHVVRDERWKFPRVVVESRLVSQLPELRKTFPNLDAGITRGALAAKAFANAGLTSVVVDRRSIDVEPAIHRDSWEALASQDTLRP